MNGYIASGGVAALVSLAALFWTPTAQANCTDLAEPMASPVDAVRLKFYPKEAGGRDDNATSFEVERGTARVRFESQEEDGDRFSINGGSVVFEEPDGSGGWRVCREEQWRSRKYFIHPVVRQMRVSPTEIILTPVLYQGAPLQERNPILALLTRHYFLLKVKVYRYDIQGRLSEEREYQSDEINNNPVRERKQAIVPERLAHCVRYHDDRPNTVAWHGHRIIDGSILECSQLTRSNSEWEEYGDLPDGRTWSLGTRPMGEVAANDIDREKKLLDGAWFGWGALYPARDASEKDDNIRKVIAEFKVGELPGIAVIGIRDLAYGSEDRTSIFTEESYRTQSLEIQYRMAFEPMPIEVALNGLEDLYNYRRIRVTQNSRLAPYIAEEFAAGSHHPVRRMWSDSNGIFREEFFDESGRPVRTINRGAFGEDMGYPEDLRGYVESGVLKVTPAEIHQFGYRMYEYDPDGRERLVLVCWEFDKKEGRPYKPFPWWTGEQPKQFANRMEQVNYYRFNVSKRCGSPDGSDVVVDGDIEAYMRETYGFGRMKFDYYNERSRQN